MPPCTSHVHALIPEFQANARRRMLTKKIPQPKNGIFPATPTTTRPRGTPPTPSRVADMLNHHNGIHTRCAKNEHRAVRRQERALIAQGTRRSDEPSEKQGGGERGGDLEAGARGPGDGLLLLLVHAGRRLRGDQPLPALPGHPARPSPACSRNRGRAWRRNENPNDFQENYPEKSTGNFERNRGQEQRSADSC